MLGYKKDPSRPGGGVFIALEPTRVKDFEGKGLPAGLIVNRSDVEGEDANAGTPPPTTSPPPPPSSASMVNITPLAGGGRQGQGHGHGQGQGHGAGGASFANVNPAMNSVDTSAPGTVQVMNVLDVPQASNTLEQFAMADTDLLEGIPGSMFDWGQWDTFFARFNSSSGENSGQFPQAGGGAAASSQQQQQQQQQRQQQERA